MNILTITGNLGRDATVNNVNGTAVMNFVVAVKSGFGDKEQTVWLDCALWGKQAESRLIDYMKKGQRVSVSGELGTREYEKDGVPRTAITCRVNSLDLEGSAPQQAAQQQQPQQSYQQPQQQPQQAPQRQQPPQGGQYGGGVSQQPQRQQHPAQGVDMSDSIPF